MSGWEALGWVLTVAAGSVVAVWVVLLIAVVVIGVSERWGKR